MKHYYIFFMTLCFHCIYASDYHRMDLITYGEQLEDSLQPFILVASDDLYTPMNFQMTLSQLIEVQTAMVPVVMEVEEDMDILGVEVPMEEFVEQNGTSFEITALIKLNFNSSIYHIESPLESITLVLECGEEVKLPHENCTLKGYEVPLRTAQDPSSVHADIINVVRSYLPHAIENFNVTAAEYQNLLSESNEMTTTSASDRVWYIAYTTSSSNNCVSAIYQTASSLHTKMLTMHCSSPKPFSAFSKTISTISIESILFILIGVLSLVFIMYTLTRHGTPAGYLSLKTRPMPPSRSIPLPTKYSEV